MSFLSRTLFQPQFQQLFRPKAFSTSIRIMATEYKLKGVSSLDFKNGQKQEYEVEGIEGGKVLLAKVNGEMHAMSPNCTHYGAPLVKGIITDDGRLTCPWHGACFKVKTGDVEDAPALDPLAKFEIVHKDGGVYIKGEEATIKANRKTKNIRCSPKGQEHVVIVGGGSGAVGAIEALRTNKFDGKITCISEENEYLPFDRTKLSKALMTDPSAVQWRGPDFYKEGGVDMVKGSVTGVDFDGKKVKTDGKEYSYTKLILASGGKAKLLPLEGLKGDLGNVFPLRTLSDTQAIMKAAGDDGGKNVVVVGSSFIGMEVGNALAGKKHNVSIIGMEEEPCERVFGKKLGAVFRSLLEKNGAKFYMSASVDKGTPSDKDKKSIGAVQLKDGTSLPADLVVEGVGISPSTGYLKDNSAVQLEKDGSIAVDEAFAVKGFKDVFAIGDIATYPYHGPGGNGKPVRIEHWNVAQNAGRSVAGTITNTTTDTTLKTASGVPVKQFIPIFWSALGSQLRYCGHTPNGYDDVVIQGETSADGPSFVAYYTLGDEVQAVASMGKDPYMSQSAELMRVGKMPGKKEIQSGTDICSLPIPALQANL